MLDKRRLIGQYQYLRQKSSRSPKLDRDGIGKMTLAQVKKRNFGKPHARLQASTSEFQGNIIYMLPISKLSFTHSIEMYTTCLILQLHNHVCSLRNSIQRVNKKNLKFRNKHNCVSDIYSTQNLLTL